MVSDPFSKKPTVKSVNRKVKRIQARQELKWLDTYTVIQPTNVGILTLLNGIAVGDLPSTRDGNEISITSVRFSGVIQTNPSDPDCTFRILLVWDKQANGAAPAVSGTDGILDVTTITSLVYAPYNRNTQERYKIIYDKMTPLFSFSPSGLAGTAFVPARKKLKFQKYLGGKTVKYNASSNTIAGITTGSLYAIVMSDSAASYPDLAIGYRIYYKDD